jgi:serine/threonine protein kinase/predicted ATPase
VTPERYARIEVLFLAALELEPAARNTFLAELAAHEPALAHELAVLLAADAGAASFIETPAFDATPDSFLQRLAGASGPEAGPAARLEPALPPEAGRLLGPYRLLELLGHGGMGVVYRGEHVETGARAAIKTIRALDQASLSGLRREIHALARLRHPGVVPILAEGVDAGGRPWYAMELIEGVTLRRHAAGLLDPAPASGQPRPRWQQFLQLVPMLRRLCSALAFLHGEGIVHRDLKPDNILIRAASGERRAASAQHESGAGPGRETPWLAARSSQLAAFPVLVDFGLAVPFMGQASREAIASETAAGGTAAYIAPEQGRGELVDARADLYALGCILYELVCGRPPFVGRTAREVLRQHLESSPLPPSHRAPDVPPQLDELVLRLLEKEPRRRLGHADAAAAALGRLGGGAEPLPGPRHRAYLYRPEFAGSAEALAQVGAALDRLEGSGAGSLLLLNGESGVGKTRLAMEAAKSARSRGLRVILGECQPLVGSGEDLSPPPGFVPLASHSSGDKGKQSAATPSNPLPLPLEREKRGGRSRPGVRAAEARAPDPPGVRLATSATPLQALAPMLRLVADRSRELGAAEADRLLGRHAARLGLYEPALLGLARPLANEPPAEPVGAAEARRRLFQALTEVLAALCTEPAGDGPRPAPTLWILDDLQWADELTVELLEHLLGSGALARIPVLILGTYRAEQLSAAQAANVQRLARAPDAATVRLERLDEAGVATLVADMLALKSAPPLFVRFLARHSEGNPFFVAEYLRAAVAEELLFRDEQGLWQLGDGTRLVVASAASGRQWASRLEALPLPRSIHALAAQRLEGLSPGARRLLEAAAVLGRELDAGLLEGVRPSGGTEHHEALQELLARQVLEEPSPGRLRFAHDKLREVAYERLTGPERRELHAAAAWALEARFGPQLDEHLAFLGHSWQQAAEPELARPYYLAAARQALRREGRHEAEILYRAYLRLVVEPTAESVRARSELAQEVLEEQARYDEALQEEQQALAEAQSLGDLHGQGRSLRGLAWLHWGRGRPAEALSLYERAAALARLAGDPASELQALDQLGSVHCALGRLAQGRELFEQALELAHRTGEPHLLANALRSLAKVAITQGAHAEGRELYRRALALYQAQPGNRLHEAHMYNTLATSYVNEMDLAAARPLYERALQIYQELDTRRHEGFTRSVLSGCVLDLGEPGQARELALEALEILSEVGDRLYQATTMHKLCRLERLCGQLDEAERWLHGSEARHRELGSAEFLGKILCEKGFLALARGRSAQPELDETREIVARTGMGPASALGKEAGRLERAQAAFEAGQVETLYRGERPEDLAPGMRRWLAETGRLPAEAA